MKEKMDRDMYEEMEKDYEDGKRGMDDRGADDKNPGRGGPRGKVFFRKKVCRFCVQKTKINYKDVDLLKRYTTERGKILPRRITGTCALHQRELAREIKKARVLAYLPFVAR